MTTRVRHLFSSKHHYRKTTAVGSGMAAHKKAGKATVAKRSKSTKTAMVTKVVKRRKSK